MVGRAGLLNKCGPGSLQVGFREQKFEGPGVCGVVCAVSGYGDDKDFVLTLESLRTKCGHGPWERQESRMPLTLKVRHEVRLRDG